MSQTPSSFTDAMFGDQTELRTARVKRIEAVTNLITVLTVLAFLLGITGTVWMWVTIFS